MFQIYPDLELNDIATEINVYKMLHLNFGTSPSRTIDTPIVKLRESAMLASLTYIGVERKTALSIISFTKDKTYSGLKTRLFGIHKFIFDNSSSTQLYVSLRLSANLRIDMFGEHIVLTNLGSNFLTNWDTVLGWNLIEDAELLSKMAIVSLLSGAPSNKYAPSIDPMWSLWDAMWRDMECVPFEYFAIVKTFYFFSLCCLIIEHEYKGTGYTFGVSLIESVTSKHRDSMLLKWVQTNVRTLSPNLFLELVMLYRGFGFPTIDPSASAANLKTLLVHRRVAHLNRGTIKNVHISFRRLFIDNYKRVHHAYPPTIPILRPNDNVDSMNDRQILELKFCHAYHYAINDNLIDSMDDKAIIQDRSAWPFEYDARAFRMKTGITLRQYMDRFGLVKRPTRRLAVFCIESDKKPVEIISIFKTDRIPPSISVLVACFKEKEYKVADARPYAKETPEFREYQTSSEDALRGGIIKDWAQTSMAQSEKHITNTLYDHSNKQVTPGTNTFSTGVDFSKWSSSFMEENTKDIFGDLDDLYDSHPLFSITHRNMKNMLFLAQSRFDVPDIDMSTGLPMESLCATYGSHRWMDGLRQKGWTLVTTSIIDAACASFKKRFSVSIYGQGDNQIATFSSRTGKISTEEMIRTAEEVVLSLVKTALGAGLLIKAEETWYSSYLFEYSKRLFYKGSEIRQYFKKMTRILAGSGGHYENHFDFAGALIASSITVNKETEFPANHLALCIDLLCTLWTVTFEQPETLGVAYALCPHILGGPRSLQPMDFLIKASMDPVADGLHFLSFVKERYADLYTVLMSIVPQKFGTRDKCALIDDPMSLNIEYLDRPFSAVQHSIRKSPEMVFSKTSVLDYFGVQVTQKSAEFKDQLVSTCGDMPRLMSKLFSNSEYGTIEKIKAKIVTSQSILSFASEALNLKSSDLKLESMRRQQRYHRIYLSRHRSNNYHLQDGYVRLMKRNNMCSARMRKDSWGFDIKGVSSAPVMLSVSSSMNPHALDAPLETGALYRLGKGNVPPGRGVVTSVAYTTESGISVRYMGPRNKTVLNIEQVIELQLWLQYVQMQKEYDFVTNLVNTLLSDKSSIDLYEIIKFEPKHNWIWRMRDNSYESSVSISFSPSPDNDTTLQLIISNASSDRHLHNYGLSKILILSLSQLKQSCGETILSTQMYSRTCMVHETSVSEERSSEMSGIADMSLVMRYSSRCITIALLISMFLFGMLGYAEIESNHYSALMILLRSGGDVNSSVRFAYYSIRETEYWIKKFVKEIAATCVEDSIRNYIFVYTTTQHLLDNRPWYLSCAEGQQLHSYAVKCLSESLSTSIKNKTGYCLSIKPGIGVKMSHYTRKGGFVIDMRSREEHIPLERIAKPILAYVDNNYITNSLSTGVLPSWAPDCCQLIDELLFLHGSSFMTKCLFVFSVSVENSWFANFLSHVYNDIMVVLRGINDEDTRDVLIISGSSFFGRSSIKEVVDNFAHHRIVFTSDKTLLRDWPETICYVMRVDSYSSCIICADYYPRTSSKTKWVLYPGQDDTESELITVLSSENKKDIVFTYSKIDWWLINRVLLFDLIFPVPFLSRLINLLIEPRSSCINDMIRETSSIRRCNTGNTLRLIEHALTGSPVNLESLSWLSFHIYSQLLLSVSTPAVFRIDEMRGRMYYLSNVNKTTLPCSDFSMFADEITKLIKEYRWLDKAFGGFVFSRARLGDWQFGGF
jgi:hypothetical protein